jgi:GNAT superfamily N-acetyltransferase
VIVSARAASEADLESVLPLAREAAAAVGSERGGPLFLARELQFADLDLVARLEAILADEDRLVAVGVVDDVVLGFAVACIAVVDGLPLARLEALWVHLGARGVGVGGELVSFASSWAHSLGADRIDAYALPGDRATKNLFEAAGFSARLIVMHRPRLRGGPGEARQ